ncbi:ABC transporter ATP-binding protein [uncultured Traorella sp.]|uniref:ABC transporter ATP-binding protein n=1 Tax=uncultured Traorella sp. TaxID=1929048 RepID=UPI0025D3A0BC|nr:ABC transporter ATP-binding protein [uncultured Traorella sp.]
MSKIKIEKALKKYGDHTVISSLDLDIRDGELFTLLGPSGCGKTTLLRMIAGFNSIEGGDFYFNDQRINDMEPSMRNIGMVFQNYAIFPHMSVRQNVEFGLKQRKMDRKEITERADRFLKLMQIEEYADRMPENLSGGQQQRIALARALVIEPDVLLMDEPLSNLDAKLRLEMREVIRTIQKNVGITTVYVTHDQEEAMAISDTIAVMNHGVLQQIASPKEIYHRPSNVFVATFIGRVNIMDGRYDHESRILRLEGGYEMAYEAGFDSQKVLVAIRPEEFEMSQKVGGLHGVVEDAVFLGLNTHYHLRLDNGERVEVIKVSSMEESYMLGEDVYLKILSEKINLFNEDGSVNLLMSI